MVDGWMIDLCCTLHRRQPRDDDSANTNKHPTGRVRCDGEIEACEAHATRRLHVRVLICEWLEMRVCRVG